MLSKSFLKHSQTCSTKDVIDSSIEGTDLEIRASKMREIRASKMREIRASKMREIRASK